MFILSLLSSLKGVLTVYSRKALVWYYGPWGGHLFRGGRWGVTNTNGKMIFFLNPGDGHSCEAHQSNALLQYIYFLAERGEYLHWLVLIWLAVPSARQHNSASSKSNNNLLLYVTGRTVLCLDSLPLISLLRLLLPISSNFKMCGFQRSSIHVPSFGKAFLYYSFVVIRISLLHVYNKSPLGVGEETLKGSTAKALNLDNPTN